MGVLAAALCLAARCSGDGATGGADLGSGADLSASSYDMSSGGDMSQGTSGPGQLTLLAGQPGGLATCDATGTLARFRQPASITTDGKGSAYVLDSPNIRKVDLATAAVTSIQVGVANGDSIVSDGAGNLYVSDPNNVTIWQVVAATGKKTSLAGGAIRGTADGTGAAAGFNNPHGLTYDGAGNLYVADTDNSTIRQIVIATGAVTTLAGLGGFTGATDGTGSAARFNKPLALVHDGAGTLYIGDSGNSTVRKLVVATGQVTTLAGSAGFPGSTDGTGSAARFFTVQGMVMDAAGIVYAMDSAFTVRKIVPATGAVSTLAGTPLRLGSADGTGAAARFYNLRGGFVDANGNLYAADAYNGNIRKIATATGVVTTFAGLAPHPGSADGTGMAATLYGPQGLVYDGAGHVYVCDTGNYTIRRIDVATSAVTTVAGTAGMVGLTDGVGAAARFAFPLDITTDGAGNLYVTDLQGPAIRQIVAATGAVTTLAGSLGQSGYTDAVGSAARFTSPAGITYDGAGNLFVSDRNMETIRKVVIATGAVTTVAGTPSMFGRTDGVGAAARFQSPAALAYDGAGSIYIADVGAIVRKMVIATAAVSTVAGGQQLGHVDGVGAAAEFSSLRGMTYDGAGSIYLSDGETIRKLVLATAAVTTVAGLAGQQSLLTGPLPGRLDSPTGLAWVPKLGLAVGDSTENVVVLGQGL